MKTDVLLIPMSARWADMRAAALAAEDAGFDGLWTWDHLRDPHGDRGPGVPEAWTVLAALAPAWPRSPAGTRTDSTRRHSVPSAASSSGARATNTRRRGVTRPPSS